MHPHTFKGMVYYHDKKDTDLPPLLLIHGYISGHHVWRTTLPYLQEKFNCILVDLIGHGASERPDDPEPYTIAAQAQRLAELMQTVVGKPYTVIGHSMGGQIALMLAAKIDPQNVTRVIDVCGVVLPRLDETLEKNLAQRVPLSYRFPMLLTLLAPLMRNIPAVAKVYYGDWFHHWDAIPFSKWRIDREVGTSKYIERTFRHGLDAIHGCDMSSLLPNINAPILAIHGRYDEVVPLAHSEVLARQAPNVKLVVVEDCGHFPMYEKPEPYQQEVLSFLTES